MPLLDKTLPPPPLLGYPNQIIFTHSGIFYVYERQEYYIRQDFEVRKIKEYLSDNPNPTVEEVHQYRVILAMNYPKYINIKVT
jgi:hypothetical protein